VGEGQPSTTAIVPRLENRYKCADPFADKGANEWFLIILDESFPMDYRRMPDRTSQ
jgi:hypothetical protein